MPDDPPADDVTTPGPPEDDDPTAPDVPDGLGGGLHDTEVATNLANWESRVPVHAASDDYDVGRYRDDPTHLSTVVAADAPHLGDLTGLRVAHVQCHLGTDTLSLARLGAAEVVGVDFSPAALAVARDLAAGAPGGERVRFVESSVAAIPHAGLGTFDLVYTSVGVLCWLPSVARWADVVAGLLAPGGRLYVRDGHPLLGTLDETRTDRLLAVTYPYFESAGPRRWEDEASYAGDEPIAQPLHYDWSHGLGETVQAVLDAGLQLTRLHEGTVLDWRFLPWMEEDTPGSGRYRLPDDQRDLLPLEFTLEAVKPAS